MKFFDFLSWSSNASATQSVIYIMDLNEDQKEALAQLRDRVEHLLPEQFKPDYDLVRWLIARNYDVDKAESMLRDSLEWRKKWDVDNLFTYKAPEVLEKYYAFGTAGHDKEGYPVWVVPYGSIDCKGILQCASTEDFIKYTIKTLEEGPRVRDLLVKGNPDVVYRQSVIFDLNSFSLRHFTWKPVVDSVIDIVQMYEYNYPENLKKAYVVNAPLMFQLLFAALKPFLAEETMKKIQVFGSKGWKEALLKDISADQLPVHYGGTMTDPDGNPKCLTKICYGGEVPKKYYSKNKLIEEKANELKSVEIKCGGKEIIEIEAPEKGNKICWEINSGNFEIAFDITHMADETESVVLPVSKMKTNNSIEEGSIVCEHKGTYKVAFYNESRFNTEKTIRYKITLETADK